MNTDGIVKPGFQRGHSEAIAESAFDPFFRPDDWARLEYGRLLWKSDRTRKRLLDHWLDSRHPHRERFSDTWRPHVERLLASEPGSEDDLDSAFQEEGLSLRVVMREIPPVFGSFF